MKTIFSGGSSSDDEFEIIALNNRSSFTEEEFYGDDIIDNYENSHEFNDCYLSNEEYRQLQTPTTQRWKDVDAKDVDVKFTINTSKSQTWKLAK